MSYEHLLITEDGHLVVCGLCKTGLVIGRQVMLCDPRKYVPLLTDTERRKADVDMEEPWMVCLDCMQLLHERKRAATVN